MVDFTSTIDSNRIFVPFEFKLENLEHLTNILDELKKAAKNLPPVAAVGMEIARKGAGGGGTPSEDDPAFASPLAKFHKQDDPALQLIKDEMQEMMDELSEEFAPSKIRKKVEDAIDQIGESGVAGDGLNLIRNPRGFIMGLLANPAVAAALIAAGYLTLMLEISMMQSGVLDKHFKRIVVDEFIKSVRPIERRMTQVGIGRQVIFTSESGSTSPGTAFNSYDALHRGGIAQVESFQIRNGYKW